MTDLDSRNDFDVSKIPVPPPLWPSPLEEFLTWFDARKIFILLVAIIASLLALLYLPIPIYLSILISIGFMMIGFVFAFGITPTGETLEKSVYIQLSWKIWRLKKKGLTNARK
jgi:hypothetical protein